MKLSMSMECGNTSGVLKDMEDELAASGDLNKTGDPSTRKKTSTPLPKNLKKKDTGFRDLNRTVIDSDLDTMSLQSLLSDGRKRRVIRRVKKSESKEKVYGSTPRDLLNKVESFLLLL